MTGGTGYILFREHGERILAWLMCARCTLVYNTIIGRYCRWMSETLKIQSRYMQYGGRWMSRHDDRSNRFIQDIMLYQKRQNPFLKEVSLWQEVLD